MTKNTPINKGNYSLETPERESLWDKYKGEGWEGEYEEYRTNWSEFAKNQLVSKYPLLLDLELSTICNLKCPMCYTITDDFKEKIKSKFMDFELFKEIIDEIKNDVPAIRLSLRGEPTLHPNFIDCIKYAKKSGIKEVSTLTNASKLTAEFFEECLKAGIDWITISVDGLGENYEKVRKPLKFNDILGKIKEIKNIKDKYNSHKPVIKIQGIWPSIKENPSEFYNTFEPYADMIAFNPLIDYLRNDKDILHEENFYCPQIFQRLVITSDGIALPCANDEKATMPMGDATEQSIYEIWHGAKLSDFREKHKCQNGFKEFDTCKQCYLPRLTEYNEKSYVDGREFYIKNYVNRKQVIGE